MFNVCDAKKDKGIYKTGYLFAFLGSGTDCRCCLGMRIALSFVLGLLMGYLALYNTAIAAAVLITFTLTLILFFAIWFMWDREQQEEDPEIILDTIQDYLGYIADGIEKIYGRSLTTQEENLIEKKLHEFKYQGVSGMQQASDTGLPIMAQWIKILEGSE